ncbi:hypothetical protein ACVIGB_008496 [Bradyrhizobium sp. USDA 4341]
MLDAVTTALLRAILDEVCQGVPLRDTGIRAHVASKILEAASQGERTRERLKQIGVDAVRQAPTMWR